MGKQREKMQSIISEVLSDYDYELKHIESEFEDCDGYYYFTLVLSIFREQFEFRVELQDSGDAKIEVYEDVREPLKSYGHKACEFWKTLLFCKI